MQATWNSVGLGMASNAHVRFDVTAPAKAASVEASMHRRRVENAIAFIELSSCCLKRGCARVTDRNQIGRSSETSRLEAMRRQHRLQAWDAIISAISCSHSSVTNPPGDSTHEVQRKRIGLQFPIVTRKPMRQGTSVPRRHGAGKRLASRRHRLIMKAQRSLWDRLLPTSGVRAVRRPVHLRQACRLWPACRQRPVRRQRSQPSPLYSLGSDWTDSTAGSGFFWGDEPSASSSRAFNDSASALIAASSLARNFSA